MAMTRQADYAIRAVLHLSLLGEGGHATTAQIARAQQIPVRFLAKIVAQLSQAGILHTARGAHGGVALGRPRDAIRVLEVLEAIDGPVTLNESVMDALNCPAGYRRRFKPFWVEAQSMLVEKLRQATFDQFVAGAEPVLEPAA